jgi:DUF3102 family protein
MHRGFTMLSKPEISRAQLEEAAARIKSLRKKATEHAVEIGRELRRIKAALPHGVFVKWVEKECEFKIRMAQDLMKLAREVGSNSDAAAVMLPSTLRVYLSKETPSEVRHLVKARVDNGERVSRSELQSAIADAKAKQPRNRNPTTTNAAFRSEAKVDLLTAGDASADSEIDRSRKVAELLMRRLSQKDYEYVMDGMNWGIWNRVLVWLRAEPRSAVYRVEAVRVAGAIGSAAAPAA